MPGWLVFLKELFSLFNDMLWIGAILCFVAYAVAPEGNESNVALGVVLIILAFISATLSYLQSSKSAAILEGFKNMIPLKSTVIRDGIEKSLEAIKLVPGDLLKIKLGEKIPADVRVITSNEMKVDNSALTGESEALLRKAD